MANVYVHQAKIRPGNDKNCMADPKVMATLQHLQANTKTCTITLSPIWNEVLTINSIKLLGPPSSFRQNPPIILIELFDVDQGQVKVYGFYIHFL